MQPVTEFLDSTAHLDDIDTLRACLERDGYLFLRDDEKVAQCSGACVECLPGLAAYKAVNTSSRPIIAEIDTDDDRTQLANIYQMKLDLLVDSILVSEKEGIRKPDPEIFWRAASRLSLKPEDCLFVGDNPVADILGATDAGMQAIWVPFSGS